MHTTRVKAIGNHFVMKRKHMRYRMNAMCSIKTTTIKSHYSYHRLY